MDAEQKLTEWDKAGLVDVGGYRRVLRQAERRQPTVVLAMGVGAAGTCYDDIARRVAAFTQVVWYDHAGFAWYILPTAACDEEVVDCLNRLAIAATGTARARRWGNSGWMNAHCRPVS
jgi:hypothetical protein